MHNATWMGIALLCSVVLCNTAHAGDQPNVIFILADDLGYGDLGSYGATHYETPSCDRLAREGMRFTDAHSPSAVCSPTRYSVLTGRYAWRSWLKNWVLQENHPLLIDPDRLTMGKVFQQAGYRTACVGKWHLGWGTELSHDFSKPVKPGPLEVGFDTFFGVPFSHNSSRRHRVYVRDREIVGLKPGLDFASEEAMKDTERSLEDTAIGLSREAVAFVTQNKNHPFFLYYPTTNIHFPLTPNKRFQGKSKAGVYGDFVVEFDWAVGELLKVLDDLDLTDKTIVVLSSDNGARPHPELNGHACNGALRGTKRTIYEGGHRVPLIVRWPGHIQAGVTSDETVCLTDFFRTFANMLEQDVPHEAGEDSADIMKVLLQQPYDSPIRPATMHHSVSGQFAIRQGDWKLIEGGGDGDFPRKTTIVKGKNGTVTKQGGLDAKKWDPDKDADTGKWVNLDYFDLKSDGVYQLFNLKEDPAEQNDLARTMPEKVQELKSLMDQQRESGRSVP
jgi:arylsulfatase A-like enzyme